MPTDKRHKQESTCPLDKHPASVPRFWRGQDEKKASDPLLTQGGKVVLSPYGEIDISFIPLSITNPDDDATGFK